ncbi:craniofacial development protein 2-like [Procambarus clarkii]|uniref:craniofacial development protein 2-like n=1 Tax=Procambarus clarkii TaxID=6728 RepID=UPI00374343F8
MTPGLSDDLLEVNDARKTAVINNKLRRLQTDVVALQETRLPATGSIREKEFTSFWQHKPSEKVRKHGVGFAIRNRLLGSIVPPKEGSARTLKLQLHTTAEMISLINAYAPTLTTSTEAKDEFYNDFGRTLRDVPQQEPVFRLGDLNARAGSDHSYWPSSQGQFGFVKMNENGQCLLEVCCRHDLCITNSFFDTKPQHKALHKNRTVPLKSVTGEIIKDRRDQQMDRWVEHYSELYSREKLISIEALDAIESLPIMEELYLELTMDEVEKALPSLSLRKAPGDDGIPPEVLKCGREILKT